MRAAVRQISKQAAIALLGSALVTSCFFSVPALAAGTRHHNQQHSTRGIVPHDGRRMDVAGSRIVGGSVSGCPRLFCSCYVAHFFGVVTKEANAAAWWAKTFVHVNPDSGEAKVAVRPDLHHVLIVRKHVSGPIYNVLDPNSGHGLTRIHDRNLAGWIFIDPYRRKS